MPGKHLFEYAIIRVVPRVEREEFVNVGVVVYCKDKKFLQARYTLNKKRLQALCSEIDCEEVESYLHSFSRICKGDKEAGPIAQLDLASRFRWLTAIRSTVVQCSKVHPGFCDEATEALERLHRELVL